MSRIWPLWLGLTGITMASGGSSRLGKRFADRTPVNRRLLAVLVVLALLGIVLYALVRFLHVRLVFWAKPDNLRSGPN